MGTWSVSITGNDIARDLISEYQAAFYYNDVETALLKLDAYVRKEFGEDEWCDYYYSLADYMWKHGILTDAVRDNAIRLIDSGTGLELWEEAGQKTLEQRQKVLADFRTKLLSPQPPKKKISVKLYTKPIFEPGDLVAIQLQTANKHYIKGSRFSEEFFRNCHGKYVVLRKVTDHVSYTSQVEPNVQDIWPVFQLYGKIFDYYPIQEDLENVPPADITKSASYHFCGEDWKRCMGTFCCEGSMFYFRKRNYKLIGNNTENLPPESSNVQLSLAYDHTFGNFDSDLLDCIVDRQRPNKLAEPFCWQYP